MLSVLDDVSRSMPEHWIVVAVCWAVSITLVAAALIDGYKLKVPNWITFPMVIGGWIFSAVYCGVTGLGFWSGLGCSLLGTAVGLGLLLPVYAIGGMGAGDVKLLAGVGAWVGATHTLWAFVVSVFVGGAIALGMMIFRGKWRRHQSLFLMILTEIFVVRSPGQLSALAAERKSSMMLLPYGIPIAIGSIAYFAWWGMLL